MKIRLKFSRILLLCLCTSLFPGIGLAQSANSSTISGTVLDPSGASVGAAVVTIHDPVSGYERTATTDKFGNFSFPNVPFNPYHMTVTAKGFAPYVQDVEVRSAVPADVKVTLSVASASTTVTVEAAADLLETDPTAHTDIDRQLFDKLPVEGSSSVSALVTLASPGVAADSNGLFHGLGDHAENSFSVDGQPITDQQSKVFSNQIPIDSIQSLEVVDGAPPAEYGDKTSLVINVTTRSGLGVATPHGSATASYGTFGTSNAAFDLSYGGPKWGNFISASGLNSGRFLDPPEFSVMHDRGNEENIFDRLDYRLSGTDSLQLNAGYTRSWFQNPNSFDQEFHLGIVDNATGNPLPLTDERSQIGTFNVAPTWTRLIGSHSVFTFGGFARRDLYHYYPSGNPLADLAPDLQAESISQSRTLTNTGLRSEISYVKGIHDLKAGVTYQQTFLDENDHLGVVDPALNPVCFNANGSPNTNPAVTTQSQCGGVLDPGGSANPSFKSFLLPFDLTRGGNPFSFNGHADIKELALYAQDSITKGNWSFNLGIRSDLYNGLASARQAEPRVGIAYKIKPSSSVLKISYARTLETPFNENLIIGSTGCQSQVLATIVPPPGVACNLGVIQPGWRNEFHSGLQQALGPHLVIDGEYIWKYTHNGYDFGVVGATPLTFPIEWHNSKITGYTLRANLPSYHGLSALVVMSSVAARFFLPQVAGIPIIPPSTGVFRIDHDEKLNQTTNLQYQPWRNGPWFGLNWRYDSGLVSGAVPCVAATATCFASTPAPIGAANIPGGEVALVNAITGAPLTADQEFEAGLTCDGKLAAPNPLGAALATCDAAGLGSLYVKVPKPGTENDDHNPQRIQPRNLFDMSVGDDNLFHGDSRKWSVRFTVINVADKIALYNFLSTFSGTHYVTPRTITGEIGFHF